MRRATSFMLSLIIQNIHQCEDADHIYVISEQARGQPGARGHHVGDPWSSYIRQHP